MISNDEYGQCLLEMLSNGYDVGAHLARQTIELFPEGTTEETNIGVLKTYNDTVEFWRQQFSEAKIPAELCEEHSNAIWMGIRATINDHASSLKQS